VESDLIRGSANVSKLLVSFVERIEIAACHICDSLFVVSETDKEKLLALNIADSKIEVIPNSVDIKKFSPSAKSIEIRQKHKLNGATVIIFHGALGYPPNKEAVHILENNILPPILKKYPLVYLLLVGGNPPKTSSSNIIATGYVDNLAEYIDAADIGVVPLLRGGGTRIKILEYMASEKAVVSTIKGAEGLTLKNGSEILMTKYPDSEFVNLVLKLIEDSDLRKKIGVNAKKRVELSYDWEKNAKKAVQIYINLVAKYGKTNTD
jgi:glycosyltransferase involved in cell wall biosynthesis